MIDWTTAKKSFPFEHVAVDGVDYCAITPTLTAFYYVDHGGEGFGTINKSVPELEAHLKSWDDADGDDGVEGPQYGAIPEDWLVSIIDNDGGCMVKNRELPEGDPATYQRFVAYITKLGLTNAPLGFFAWCFGIEE